MIKASDNTEPKLLLFAHEDSSNADLSQHRSWKYWPLAHKGMRPLWWISGLVSNSDVLKATRNSHRSRHPQAGNPWMALPWKGDSHLQCRIKKMCTEIAVLRLTSGLEQTLYIRDKHIQRQCSFQPCVRGLWISKLEQLMNRFRVNC